MKHENTFLVTPENGPRPNGPPDECFYCQAKVGTPHVNGCCCRLRSVVATFSINLILKVPEHWEKEDIEFKFNDGTWCASNLLRELYLRFGQDEAEKCACGFIKAEYRREAKDEDVKFFESFEL